MGDRLTKNLRQLPLLSVIVTVVDSGTMLTRCLEALERQVDPPPLDIIVPYDDTTPEVAAIAKRFPMFRFLDLGALRDPKEAKGEFARHDLYDRRRAAGLHAARGELLAMVEDRGYPRPDWAREIVDVIHGSDYAAVGGGVENGADHNLLWAVFFCDFGRYQLPLDILNPEYMTVVNICYTREALHSVAELWDYKYQEPRINWALRRQSRRLYLSSRPIVIDQRAPIGLMQLLSERIHWARTFGQLRGRETSRTRCLIRAATTPLLPFLLFVRHFRRQLQKRRHVGKFMAASPALFALLAFWALGECIGYVEAVVHRVALPERRAIDAR
jgi:hypothetical protein